MTCTSFIPMKSKTKTCHDSLTQYIISQCFVHISATSFDWLTGLNDLCSLRLPKSDNFGLVLQHSLLLICNFYIILYKKAIHFEEN